MVKGKTNSAPGKNNDGNANKRSREDLDKAEDEVETLTDLLDRMQDMFEKTNAKIDSCKEDLQTEISSLRDDVQLFKSECTGEINRLSSSVVKMRADIHQNYDRIRAVEKSKDLLLAGIPYAANEDVYDISRRVAIALGYTEQNKPMIYAKRLARGPIAIGATPPIALQFAFKLARDDFFRRYFSVRNLSLIHIGFNVDRRIYLNENLSEEARKIKGKAISLRRAGKLHAVFTKDGCVFVKPAMDAEAVLARSLDDLSEYENLS